MSNSLPDNYAKKLGTIPLLLTVGALILISVGLLVLLKTILAPRPPEQTPAPAAGQLVITQKADGELLPGLPSQFPTHEKTELVSSYTGKVGSRPAYGATWQVPDDTVFKVMEWYSEEMAEAWIFDSPQDEDNIQMQSVTAHLKDGPQVMVTVSQLDATTVEVKADFIL